MWVARMGGDGKEHTQSERARFAWHGVKHVELFTRLVWGLLNNTLRGGPTAEAVEHELSAAVTTGLPEGVFVLGAPLQGDERTALRLELQRRTASAGAVNEPHTQTATPGTREAPLPAPRRGNAVSELGTPGFFTQTAPWLFPTGDGASVLRPTCTPSRIHHTAFTQTQAIMWRANSI